MQRIKPYTTNQESWNTILMKTLRIPMNQREYSWESKEIIKFLDDIFKIYEEEKYVEKMGSIINLNYKNENYIYDGQQRILTIILILKVIGSLCPRLENKINTLLTIDNDLDELTDEQKEIQIKCDATKIPKIYSINPFDMVGLVNIFNNKVIPWVTWLDNFDDIQSFEDEEYYSCIVCKRNISKKKDFIRHLKNFHNYTEHESNTKLYNAFIDIFNFFKLKRYHEKQYILMYKFILNDIDIQFYDCTNPEYVSRIFDWENNRGKSVEKLDIIKNPIIVKIPNNKKMEVYEKWESLKHTPNKIYKEYGQKIFDIAIQIYNKKIKRVLNIEEVFETIINHNNTYKELQKFFSIVEKLFEIMNNVIEDKFGRLVNNTCRVCLNWEAYMWCMLPIFYATNSINIELIKLMTKWYFRNLQFKNRSFNNLCYSNEFIRISNDVIQNPNYDYYRDIEHLFCKNKSVSINDENYKRSLHDMNFKSTNATYVLLFLETCMNTNTHIVNINSEDKYTLEHIYPQKHKDELKKHFLMDNIGNLTIIECKNSENGHKGNCSLGSKTYAKKRESYKGSSSKLTRMIAERYECFDEDAIVQRNNELTLLLDEYTNY